MSALKKGRSEARPRADVRTRPRVRELFSVESFVRFAHSCHLYRNSGVRDSNIRGDYSGVEPLRRFVSRSQDRNDFVHQEPLRVSAGSQPSQG
jgi:hypothetical protein